MKTTKHFPEQEFNRCTPSCSMQDMEQATLDLIDKLRDTAGIPLILNCAYRSREWDLAKGRSGNSAHTKGRAVDIRCSSSSTRFKIIKAALEIGIKRIGIAKTFVHLDNDPTLPNPVIFDYK